MPFRNAVREQYFRTSRNWDFPRNCSRRPVFDPVFKLVESSSACRGYTPLEVVTTIPKLT